MGLLGVVAFRESLFFIFLHLLLMISTCDGHAVLCKAEEREALLQFKDGFSEANMISSWGVGEEEDCCSWIGIRCDNRTGHVLELNLQGGLYDFPLLRGKISPSLAVLKYLRRLDLSKNDFEGSSIPHFLGSFERLRYLDLSSANFDGVIPQHLGNLSSLQYLDLSELITLKSNYAWLSQLYKLQYLDLSYMDLTMADNLFEVLNMLPSLDTLILYSSGIDYAILSLRHVSFSRLSELWLTGGRFHNPCWLFDITSLEYLYLRFDYIRLDVCRNDFTAKLCNLKSLYFWSFQRVVMKRDLSQFFMECNRRLNLVNLEFQSIYLTGQLPSWLGEYTSLKTLYLRSNKLSGSVPESIGAMTSLKEFSLRGNNLMGSIPQSIGGLQSLEYLDLSRNNLSGPLPSSLWEIKSLQYLDLSGNSLCGSVSEEHFVRMTNLTTMYLSSNSLQVMLTPYWVPPFRLSKLGLGSCKLGPAFPLWLRTQNNLKVLNMSDSNISDVLPYWIWNFSPSCRYMDLSMNNLRGVVPAATNSSWKTDIVLHSNLLEGSLSRFPRVEGSLIISNNFFSGPITDMSNAFRLSISRNNLTGSIPPSLCEAEELVYLDLSYNGLSGRLPSCVGSQYQMPSIVSLHLNNNNLRGTLPAWMGNCRNMQLLDIGENRFFGEFPNWIPNNMLHLKVLRLRSNSFYGSIPMELSNLTSLQVLDLADNNFSGSIPHTIGNLSAMKIQILGNETLGFSTEGYYKESIVVTSKGLEIVYDNVLKLFTSIDLSGNKLSGDIPGEVGRLVYLRNLNLSQNYFSGCIPETFAKLSQLESLDLSRNNLSGWIPSTLSGLTFLSTFNVSFNNLSGRIPSGGQFNNFPNSSYLGNLNLCGKPLQVCQSDLFLPAKGNNIMDSETDHYFLWFCFSIVLGFITGFWTFWGTLLFKRNWRNAYLQFVDELCEKCYFYFKQLFMLRNVKECAKRVDGS